MMPRPALAPALARALALALALPAALPAAAQEAVRDFGPDGAARRLVLRTTTDISVFAPTVEAFLAARPGVAVRYEQWGSNALFALTAADCAAGRAGADIVISSGVHQMVKLVNDGCAAAWVSEPTRAIPDALRWRDEIWGISREPAVIVYNRTLVPAAEVPRTRFDLLDLMRAEDTPYRGRVATYDIEASGLGFLFAFVDSQEATTFGALMEAFSRAEAVATCCSAEIIDGVAAGDYLIAYNVLGSYAEAAAGANPDLGIVAPRDYTLVLSRAAILPGPQADPLAGAFLDFVLGPAGQVAMAAGHLAAVGPGSAGDESEEGVRRLISLGPPLLVALDPMTAGRFIERWRQTFAD